MKININKKLLTLASLALVSSFAMAQETVTVSGKVVDGKGNPLAGSAIAVVGQTNQTVTDASGNYSISLPAGASLKFSFLGYESQIREVAGAASDFNIVLADAQLSVAERFVMQPANIGTQKVFSRSESTASFDVIENKDLNKRSAKNIGNDILGQGSGLITLDGQGNYFGKNPTFYVRGLQSLDNNSPLFVVDGVERNITIVSPEEVESVTILKDAAAVALYGLKGSNGVVLISTKRGAKDSGQTIGLRYDRSFNFYAEKPEFVDGPTWARAMNEALANDGKTARFSERDLQAFDDVASGKNEELKYWFPNVDWASEVFRNSSYTNRYALDFSGGSKKFQYYTVLGLTTDKGFVKGHDVSDFDTQDIYSRGNIRANLDIQVTDYTKLDVNVAAAISEMQKPGNGGLNLWSNVYNTPAAAFPVKNEKGQWGGNSVWAGENNPVAQATGAAGYYKLHERSLFADVAIDQSFEAFVEGLGMMGQISYDNFSTLFEDYSKTYTYGQTYMKWDENGNYIASPNSKGEESFVSGDDGELGTGSNTDAWQRRASIMGGLYFDRAIGSASNLYSQFKYLYEYEDVTGTNTTVNRQTMSLWAHYVNSNRYIVDLALVATESNRLAEGHKWNFAPTVSAAWVMSNEDFLAGNEVVDFLKVRASYGKVANDWLPGGSWTYDKTLYTQDGVNYPLTSKYDGVFSRPSLAREACLDPKNEAAYKFNIGLEATLLKSLNVEFDYFNQTHKNIWIDTNNQFTSVYGFTTQFANEGEVKSSGIEFKADFNKSFGDFALRLGGHVSYSTSEIVNMGEEPRAFDNLVETGGKLKQMRGLVALGLFKDQADIDNSPKQNFTTVRPGDIKYKDINGDGVIDSNDKTEIGYSTTAPEIVYSFHLGAEWKGIGLNALFQGTGNYSALLNTKGYYFGIIDNANIGQEVYDKRWSPENPDVNALYPRLSSASNSNNQQTSDFWLRDRSYLKLRNLEVYYNFSESLMKKTFLNSAKVYVRGIDLFTIDDIDNFDAATYSAATPSTRSVVAGLALTF